MQDELPTLHKKNSKMAWEAGQNIRKQWLRLWDEVYATFYLHVGIVRQQSLVLTTCVLDYVSSYKDHKQLVELTPTGQDAFCVFQRGLDPNCYIGNGWAINDRDTTPLAAAIQDRSVIMVQEFLFQHADPNLPTIWRDGLASPQPPLFFAYEEGSIYLVSLLLHIKATPVLPRGAGVYHGSSVDCLELLLQEGATLKWDVLEDLRSRTGQRATAMLQPVTKFFQQNN